MGWYAERTKIVARVPPRKKKFICDLCGYSDTRDGMIDHLTDKHGREVEGFGYAIYEK